MAMLSLHPMSVEAPCPATPAREALLSVPDQYRISELHSTIAAPGAQQVTLDDGRVLPLRLALVVEMEDAVCVCIGNEHNGTEFYVASRRCMKTMADDEEDSPLHPAGRSLSESHLYNLEHNEEEEDDLDELQSERSDMSESSHQSEEDEDEEDEDEIAAPIDDLRKSAPCIAGGDDDVGGPEDTEESAGTTDTASPGTESEAPPRFGSSRVPSPIGQTSTYRIVRTETLCKMGPREPSSAESIVPSPVLTELGPPSHPAPLPPDIDDRSSMSSLPSPKGSPSHPPPTADGARGTSVCSRPFTMPSALYAAVASDDKSPLERGITFQSWMYKRRKPTKKWARRFGAVGHGALFYFRCKAKSSYDVTAESSVKANIAQPVPCVLFGPTIGYPLAVSIGKVSVMIAVRAEYELKMWAKMLNSVISGEAERDCMVHTGLGYLFLAKSKKWYEALFTLSTEGCTSGGKLSLFYASLRGLVPLDNAVIEPDVSGASPEMVVRYGDGRQVYLSMSSPSLFSEWCGALNNETEHAKKANSGVFPLPYSDPAGMLFQAQLKSFAANGTSIPKSVPKSESQKYFILSVDGGGVRGVMVCIILCRILQHLPDFLDRICMVSGCSNGGMVAMALAYGLSPAAGRSMLEYGSPFIFGSPTSLVYLASWPKYSDKFLKLTCEATWGNKKLCDAYKHLVVPAFQLDNGAPGIERSWEPVLFHNVNNDDDPMAQELASDVVMYATTAPTYFPNHKGYVDGGMFDLEPSSSALMLAMAPGRLNLPPEDICLLSMGTGAVQRYVEGDTTWGIRQWLPKLMDMMWDGMVMKSINHCSEMLHDRYHRLQMHLEEDITLDDPAEMPRLAEMAYAFDITETLQWIYSTVYS